MIAKMKKKTLLPHIVYIALIFWCTYWALYSAWDHCLYLAIFDSIFAFIDGLLYSFFLIGRAKEKVEEKFIFDFLIKPVIRQNIKPEKI